MSYPSHVPLLEEFMDVDFFITSITVPSHFGPLPHYEGQEQRQIGLKSYRHTTARGDLPHSRSLLFHDLDDSVAVISERQSDARCRQFSASDFLSRDGH